MDMRDIKNTAISPILIYNETRLNCPYWKIPLNPRKR